MTRLSSLSFFSALDLIRAGKVSSSTFLRLASCNRWLSRAPLSFRLKAIGMLRA